ncbi:hypothetical protein EX30DRAFT_391945 [Ascodesmis nigricans]|uniref:Smr domain-containing protein n=1 Tax=Ascodesmis nigricans TaxID=341454 RepID=A0A4S2N5L5_9PEZI|nr:hypothetical protein EX30DRAFT_391945 [Ascodesmis nigricans]
MASPNKEGTEPMSVEEALRILEFEYPNLDSALVASIYYDTKELDSARATLQILQGETAVDDDATSSPNGRDLTGAASEWMSWTSESDQITQSMASCMLSEDSSMSGSSSGASSDLSRGIDPTRDPPELVALAGMFPTVSKYSLQRALMRCNNDYSRAVDELLNRAYLETDGVGRGVDGFSEDLVHANGKNGKRKKGKKQQFALSRFANDVDGLDTAPQSPGGSRWNAMADEIQRISRGLQLPEKTVRSAYHTHGSKLAPTIMYLLEKYDNGGMGDEDSEEHYGQLADLADEFGKSVNPTYLDKLLRMCKSDKAAVFHLADILSQYQPPPPPIISTTSKPGVPTLTPVRSPTTPTSCSSGTPSTRTPTTPTFHHNLASSDKENWQKVTKDSRTTPSYLRPTNFSNTSDLASHSKSLRNSAFMQASEAYKRSKSDRLMGGAAAYYAELGKDHDRHYKELNNLAAEQLVSANSSPYFLDLHGVTVQQGVKIAKEHTTRWWVESKPDDRRGIKPLVIVTGMGRHSKDHQPKLFPAIKKLLERDGWDHKVDKGQIIVYQKSNRR